MLDASSYGRAAPKVKTINVEANLLSERITERTKQKDRSQRQLIYLFAVIAAGCFVLPAIFQFQKQASEAAKQAAMVHAQTAKQLADLEQRKATITPVLADDEMMKSVHTNAEKMLGQITQFLNSANPQMVFSTVRCSVESAEAKILCQADAETFENARTFFVEAAKGPEVIDVLPLTTRQSQTLGRGSVTFDLVKRVRVGE